MNNKNIFLNLVLLSLLYACNGVNGTKVEIEQKQPRPLNTTLTSVSVVNDQLIIRGTGLSTVTKVQLSGSGTTGTYDVVSATANEIIVNAASAVAIGVGRTLDLLISNAEAQASYQITFDLNNNSVTSQHINDMGATAGQVLKYNGTNWVPGNLPSSQLYLGSFDADNNVPDLSSPSSQAGDYYIVSVAGTFNSVAYDIGDWIISDGVAWQRIANAAPSVTSFEGRQGAVVLTSGDYVSLLDTTTQKLIGSSLDNIADVDTTGIAANKILKYDGTNWVMADDIVGGGAGSVGTAELQNSSVTYQKMSLTDGEVPQAKISGVVTAFTTINTSLAGKIGLSNLTATAPLVYNNGTGAFSIGAASTTAAGSLSAADKTKLDALEALSAGDGLLERFSGSIRSSTCVANQILKWNAVSGWTCSSDSNTDTSKLPLAGGTLTGDLIVNTEIQLKDGAATNYVTLKAPASGTTSYTLTFPNSVGANNQVLTTNASGVLSWTTPSSTGTPIGSAGGDLTGSYPNPTIGAGKIVDAQISATAAIAQSKVSNLTTDLSTLTTNVAGKIGLTNLSATAPLVYNNTTGAFTINAATTTLPGTLSAADKTKIDLVSGTELGYLAGVTSDVQSQLDDKLNESGGTLTGNLIVNTELQLKDGSANNYVTLKAPASGTTSYSLTFPATVGANNQVLTTNASGVLSWTTVATGSTAVGGDLSGTISSATIVADAITSAKVLDGTLINADINAAAAIAQSKISNLTTDLSTITSNVAGKIGLTNLSATAPLVYNNTTGTFTMNAATTSLPGSLSAADKTKIDSVSATELSYVAGVTSDIQTQLDARLLEAGGTMSGDLVLDTQLKLKDGASANYVNLRAPATGTTTYTLTFPATVGSANQVLTTNASGVLSWTTVATSGTAVGGDLTGTIASATIAADAVTSAKIIDGTLVNADINASAAIAQSKIANLTTDLSTITTNVAGKIGLTALTATAPLVYNNSTGAFTVNASTASLPGTMSAADKTKLDSVSSTELDYLVGVTSDVQTQIDTKFAKAGGTLSGDLLLDTQLRLKDGAASNYVTLKAPASGTTSYTLTFPAAVGTANQVLTTNASGVLSWTTVATSGTSVGGDLTGTIASATIATDAVTSGKVLDGTLVNADINASAAIAQSKIANLTTDLSTITTSLAGKIGLTSLTATAPLVYNNTTGAFTIDAASTTAPGSLSAADKTKLNGLEALSAGDGIFERFSGVVRSNTCAANEVLKWNVVSGWTCGSDNATDATKLPLAGGTLTGNLIVNTEILLKDGAASNYVTLKAPASGTTSYTLTFPSAVGTNNQVLTTNASGVLSWTTVATSGTAVGGDLTGTIASATIAADAVTSAKIIDGTLVNADINASAAIAQSKIANLTTDLSTITTNVAGKIGLTALSATAPLVYSNTTGSFTVNAATTSLPGSMSAADKIKLDSVSTTELDYLVGVSGDIQTQIDTKFAKAGGTLTGDLLLDTQLRLKDGAASNYVTLKAPASGTTSYTLTFPAAVGSANQVLTTNASGVLSWTTVGTATAVGGDLTGTVANAVIAADAVTSAKIIDGTLVNADINASAAIAQSKIANLTTDLAGKIGLTALSATAPLVYNNTTGAFTIDAASTTAPGSLSAADKTKLNGLEALSAGDGIFERFSGVVRSNTCSANEVLKWNVVAGWTCGTDNATDATKLPLAGGTLTGNLIVNTEMQLKDGAAASYVTLKAPASGTSSYTLTFPAAVGANNQVLTTNASGVLSWTTVATSGTAVGGDLTGTIASATIAADAVTSAKIIDGTLVNADINASAAIAQSKIANLTTDLSTITTNVAGKIGLTALSATAPLVYNNTTGAFTMNAATTALPGSMSAADKTKLDVVSSTELDYLAGISSDVQTQIDTKFAKAGGTLTGDLTLETELKLKDGASANYVNLRAPASGTSSYTLTFPTAVGSANQVLTTNASGVLSWTTIGTSTSVGGDLTGTVASATIAADAVTSAKIADGSIVNADINASAAIAQSKVANLTTDLAGKIGLTALSATAPLVYNNTTGAFTVSAATIAAAGTMSSADKTKIDALEILSTGAGLFERFGGAIESNTCTAGQVLVWNAVGGWICSEVVSGVLGTVTPSDVAITTGDIIADAFNKAQGQINAKANIASPTFTGIPAADTAAAGTSTTQLATTAFVTTADSLRGYLTKIAGNSGAAGPDTTWQTLTSNSSDQTSTTPAAVMTTTGVGAGTWKFKYTVIYQSGVTTTGIKLNVNHTGTVTTFSSLLSINDSSTSASTGVGRGVATAAIGNIPSQYAERVKGTTSFATAGVVDANANIQAVLEGIVVVTATGSLTLQLGSEVNATAVRLVAGSTLELLKMN